MVDKRFGTGAGRTGMRADAAGRIAVDQGQRRQAARGVRTDRQHDGGKAGTHGDPVAERRVLVAGAFTPTGSMTVARWGHSATLLDNGKVLIAGGGHDVAFGLASAELYDPATETFASTGSMTLGRDGHTATLLGNGKVLIAGGSGDEAGYASTSAELYDPDTDTFAATGSMSDGRCMHTATPLSDGRVLVAGGRNSAGEAIASAEIYE